MNKQAKFKETLKAHDVAQESLLAKFIEHATIARNIFRKKQVVVPEELAWTRAPRRVRDISFKNGFVLFNHQGNSYFIPEKLFFSDMGTIAKHYRTVAKETRKLNEYRLASTQALRDLEKSQREERIALENKVAAHTRWLQDQADGGARHTRNKLTPTWGVRDVTNPNGYNWNPSRK